MTSTLDRPAPVADGPADAAARPPRHRRSFARALPDLVVYVALVIIAAAIVVPLLWMLLTSFRTDFDTVTRPAVPIPDPWTTDAYRTLLGGAAPILRWFANSLIAAASQTAIVLVTASMAAYALARLEFPGRRIVFGALIATLLVPGVVFLVPNYLIIDRLGWLDTLWAVIVPGSAGAFGVFFLRQFFVSLPGDIEEAARVDGAGDVRIFLRIVLPLARPALATLAVLTFLTNWNDFIWPVYVLLSPEVQTLQPGLSTLEGSYQTHYGIIMAGAVIASVPVLVLFTLAQRQIVESVANAGIKG
ncbi:carbohydrate ABC transporter permease [Galbitalea sp. SE-J8]|uniref:carbohydrate ABC transporter permease n=1 Tax=Galbitalea sp. SE-J8 TaxID=3054952 RepID=UPI00259CE27D|nr:carbohydrate ABC transporter permease [Galbitalea sp. SE-J8]MDM4762142.1 carbohydrate ABC transporter permease [Galbitalea sp. SE-J8]